jgi:transcriptional regulator with XRE-family HTH domain
MNIGEAIKGLRLVARMTQEDLADRARISPTNLCCLERGTHNPNLQTLSRVAGALGVKTSELVALAEERSACSTST